MDHAGTAPDLDLTEGLSNRDRWLNGCPAAPKRTGQQGRPDRLHSTYASDRVRGHAASAAAETTALMSKNRVVAAGAAALSGMFSTAPLTLTGPKLGLRGLSPKRARSAVVCGTF